MFISNGRVGNDINVGTFRTHYAIQCFWSWLWFLLLGRVRAAFIERRLSLIVFHISLFSEGHSIISLTLKISEYPTKIINKSCR
jgi:hypothetical protein